MLEINDVAAYVVAKAAPLDNMKLQKLLYYSQAWHLAITDSPMFADQFTASTIICGVPLMFVGLPDQLEKVLEPLCIW